MNLWSQLVGIKWPKEGRRRSLGKMGICCQVWDSWGSSSLSLPHSRGQWSSGTETGLDSVLAWSY